MPSSKKPRSSSPSRSGPLPSLTERDLANGTVKIAASLRSRTEDNLAKARQQLDQARKTNSTGQKDAYISDLARKIRKLEIGLKPGGPVDRHQSEDVKDAQRTYEFAKATE